MPPRRSSYCCTTICRWRALILGGSDPGRTSSAAALSCISENASAFATENYTLDLGGEEQRAFEGNLGLTVKRCWQNVPMHGHSPPLAGSPA